MQCEIPFDWKPLVQVSAPESGQRFGRAVLDSLRLEAVGAGVSP